MFGLGETSLEVCFCVIDSKGATVSEVAEEMGLDRSAVSRHVNRLVETGVLTREERNLRQGGVVHVYEHEDPEVVKERLKLGSYLWVAEAVELIAELNDEKAEAMGDEDETVMEALGGEIWKG
jgi:predicted transcriptional regulator